MARSRKGILRNPIFMLVAGFFGGVMFGATIKPMLADLPVIGGLFDGSASEDTSNEA